MADRSLDYFSKTLEKGMRILDLFDEDHSRWSQKNIAEAMQLNTTSTCRLINTFVEMRYLVKDDEDQADQSRTDVGRLGTKTFARL